MKELTLTAASYLLIGLLGTTAFIFSVVSLRKENSLGHPLRGIFWFTLPIICLCGMVLLAEYLEKARALDRVSNLVEAMSSRGLESYLNGTTPGG